MNTIRLEVDNKYNFYLENIYISSKVYDDENRDVFTNSYSLSFNIPLQDKDANKLFNYLQTNKSSFQNVKFEDCKLYVNEDLLSETITFTLIEVINGGFNCFILLNEYTKILLTKENKSISEIIINENIPTSTLNFYSGSTTMYNPIPSTLNAKFILNNNYNYNGTDNYLTINKDLQISEEDLVFNFNIGGLLRSFLKTGTTVENSFTSLDNDYFFKIGQTEFNYNTVYNKFANSGVTGANYNNFRYNKNDGTPNSFQYISYSSNSSTYVYQPYKLISDSEESSFGSYTYKYSYFNNESNTISKYNNSTSSIELSECYILKENPIKWINLPIYTDVNNNNNLSPKFDFIIQQNSNFGESIFFNNNNFNSFIIPSYNDFEFEFNENLAIGLDIHRILHQSDNYDKNNDYPLRENILYNATTFALGFSNSEYADSIEKVMSFIQNFYYIPIISSSTVTKNYLLDDYFEKDILDEINGLIFYKISYPFSRVGSNDVISSNSINVLKFYTQKMLDNNNGNLSQTNLNPDNTIQNVLRNSTGNYLRFFNGIQQPNNSIKFKYIHPKESSIKELKSFFIMYDNSGYIVPTFETGNINLDGFEIHNTGVNGKTAFLDTNINLVNFANNSSLNNIKYTMKCKYNNDDDKYIIDSNLLPSISLTQLFKELCIIKGGYIYYDNNYIDIKSLTNKDDYYLLKNYSSLKINKLSEYKNPSINFPENINYWITANDETNIYSDDLNKNPIYSDKVKHISFFSYTDYQNRLYNSGNTLTNINTLQLSSPERYNQNRISYTSDFNKNIDSGKDYYEGFYGFRLFNTTLDDSINNNDGKSVNFINKLGTISEETIFSPKDFLLNNNAIYEAGIYNVLFGEEYKSKFEATIKIPFHIWKECKNRPILIEDDGVKYIVFEIEQYNITTEICTVKGIKS